MSLDPLSNKKLLRGLASIATALVVATALSGCAPYHAQRGVTKFHQRGKASWYGPGFAGRKTANGERFNPGAMTAAHKTLPFGTTVEVTNLQNGKRTVVRINDRGPYAGGRIIDLSKAAAKKIGLIQSGVAKVEIRAVGPGGKKRAKEEPPAETAEAEDEPEKVLLAARGGSVRRNGVEYLISVDHKSNPPDPEAPEEVVAEPESAPVLVAEEPAEPAPKPYSVDDEPF